MKYLKPQEVERVQLSFEHGRLYDSDRIPFSSPYFLNLVISARGEFFAFSPKDFDRPVSHSSPVQGAPVIFAGEALNFDGRFDFLSNKSGHYKTGLDELVGIVKAFHKSGMDISHTEIVFEDGVQRFVLGKGNDIIEGHFSTPPHDRSQTLRLHNVIGRSISETKFESHRNLYLGDFIGFKDFLQPSKELFDVYDRYCKEQRADG